MIVGEQPLQAANRDFEPGDANLLILGSPAFWHRTANPYTWLLYSHMAGTHRVRVDDYHWKRLIKRNYQILHFHWPEGHLNEPNPHLALFRSLSILGLSRLAKIRGTKIVWTIHNLRSHEGFYPTLEKYFWKYFLPCLDGYISLSRTAQREALARFPRLRRVPGFIVPIGHYREAYTTRVTRTAARDQLGIDHHSTVLAFVGQVRSYKNVPRLISAFQGMTDPSSVLLVAGESKSTELTAELQKLGSADPRVRLRLEWISDEQLLSCLAAADLVVLPFAEVLNSSSALLALSFDRPILVPRMGSLAELQELVGAEWVRTYSGLLTTDKLQDAVEWAMEAARSASAPLDLFQWDRIAVDTIAAYRSVLTAVPHA